MVDQPRYSKAPIIEAIFDLRVEPSGGTTVSQLEACGDEEKDRYPNKTKVNYTEAWMETGPKLSASATTEHIGFSFATHDRKQLFQAQMKGFSHNRLAPYGNWEPFRDEARRLWMLYRRIASPTKVTRMALRYVNRLDLPLPVRDLRDYLRTSPEISPDLPQTLAGFFMQLKLPQTDLGSNLILNQTIIDPPKPEVVSIVLDIDLFRDSDLPGDEEGIWHLFEVMRGRKNEVFEACITDRTRELIR